MATWILEIDEEDGQVFKCPLALDGSETEAKAHDRLDDAIAVYRNALMVKEGRRLFTRDRIDGLPTAEQEEIYASVMRQIEGEK